MTALRRFALIFGIVFLLVGIAGFIPGITQPHSHPDVMVTAGLGAVLGLFAVNILLTVMGLIKEMNLHTAFGFVPLYGHDVWLHALLAAVGAYFGFMRPHAQPMQRV
jgi:hypothetical protein